MVQSLIRIFPQFPTVTVCPGPDIPLRPLAFLEETLNQLDPTAPEVRAFISHIPTMLYQAAEEETRQELGQKRRAMQVEEGETLPETGLRDFLDQRLPLQYAGQVHHTFDYMAALIAQGSLDSGEAIVKIPMHALIKSRG